MTIIFSDTFDRANSTSLGTSWTEAFGDSTINTNNLRAGVSASSCPGQVVTTPTAHAPLADCKVQITQRRPTGVADGGVIARQSVAGNPPTMYVTDVYTGRCELYRHDANVNGTLLGSGVSITAVADGVIALEVRGTDATVVLKSYYQGVLRETVNDTSANRITTAQQTGVFNSRSAADGDSDYDDFSVSISPSSGSLLLTGAGG